MEVDRRVLSICEQVPMIYIARAQSPSGDQPLNCRLRLSNLTGIGLFLRPVFSGGSWVFARDYTPGLAGSIPAPALLGCCGIVAKAPCPRWRPSLHGSIPCLSQRPMVAAGLGVLLWLESGWFDSTSSPLYRLDTFGGCDMSCLNCGSYGSCGCTWDEKIEAIRGVPMTCKDFLGRKAARACHEASMKRMDRWALVVLAVVLTFWSVAYAIKNGWML